MSVSETRDVRGVTAPSFMYGTAWKEQRTQELTELAIARGFRAIDTANQRKHYFELGVGAAIATAIQGGLTRQDLFLQTKFTYRRGQDHRLPYDVHAAPAEQVAQSFASSLEHLGTDYVDSYVLHGPSRSHGLTDEDWQVWRAMEALQRAGTTRLLGVSNISYEQLDALCAGAEVTPAFVQNRCYARFGWDRDVRELCAANDIVYQGFSLLTANQRELSTPAVGTLAQRSGCTLAQLVFRFALQVGMLPLTGTSNAAHMTEDLGAFECSLDGATVAALENV
jgi:diketogulonate reductase-like aldo/keto reductase